MNEYDAKKNIFFAIFTMVLARNSVVMAILIF